MIDLGTGDGAAVLDAARRSADTLCVGVDTDTSRLREASARASRSPRRGGIPNAVFLAGDASPIPRALHGCADAVSITLPWGSLLRSVLTADERFVSDLARVLRPGGQLRMVVSVEDRDRAAVGAADADPEYAGFAAALTGAGLAVIERREVTAADMATIRSSWARRLGIPTRRTAWLLVVRKPGPRR